jgi:hypothetical protein
MHSIGNVPGMSPDIGLLLQLVQQLIPVETAVNPTHEHVRTLERLIAVQGPALLHSVVLSHLDNSFRNCLRAFSQLSEKLSSDEHALHTISKWIDALNKSMGRLNEVCRGNTVDRAAEIVVQQLQQQKAALVKPIQKRMAMESDAFGLPPLERPPAHDLALTGRSPSWRGVIAPAAVSSAASSPRLSAGHIPARTDLRRAHPPMPDPIPASHVAAASSAPAAAVKLVSEPVSRPSRTSTGKRKEIVDHSTVGEVENAPSKRKSRHSNVTNTNANSASNHDLSMHDASDGGHTSDRAKKKSRKDTDSHAPSVPAAVISAPSIPSISSDTFECICRVIPDRDKLKAIAPALFARAYGLSGQPKQNHSVLVSSARAATGTSINYIYSILYGNMFDDVLASMRQLVPLHERQMEVHHGSSVSPLLKAALNIHGPQIPTLKLDSFSSVKAHTSTASNGSSVPTAASTSISQLLLSTSFLTSSELEQSLLTDQSESVSGLEGLRSIGAEILERGFGLNGRSEENRVKLVTEALRRVKCRARSVNMLLYQGLFDEFDHLRRGLRPHEQRKQTGRMVGFNYDNSIWRNAVKEAENNHRDPDIEQSGSDLRTTRSSDATTVAITAPAVAEVESSFCIASLSSTHLDCLLESRTTPTGVEYLTQLCNSDGDVIDVAWLPEEKVRRRSDLIESFERSRRMQNEERQMEALDNIAAAGAVQVRDDPDADELAPREKSKKKRRRIAESDDESDSTPAIIPAAHTSPVIEMSHVKCEYGALPVPLLSPSSFIQAVNAVAVSVGTPSKHPRESSHSIESAAEIAEAALTEWQLAQEAAEVASKRASELESAKQRAAAKSAQVREENERIQLEAEKKAAKSKKQKAEAAAVAADAAAAAEEQKRIREEAEIAAAKLRKKQAKIEEKKRLESELQLKIATKNAEIAAAAAAVAEEERERKAQRREAKEATKAAAATAKAESAAKASAEAERIRLAEEEQARHAKSVAKAARTAEKERFRDVPTSAKAEEVDTEDWKRERTNRRDTVSGGDHAEQSVTAMSTVSNTKMESSQPKAEIASPVPVRAAPPTTAPQSLSELLQQSAHRPRYIVIDGASVAHWQGSGSMIAALGPGVARRFESWQVVAAVKAVEKQVSPLGIKVITCLGENYLRKPAEFAVRDPWALLQLQRQNKLNLLPEEADIEHALITLSQQDDTYVLSNSALTSHVSSGLITDEWRQAHVVKFWTLTLPGEGACAECSRARLHWNSHCTVEEGTGSISQKGSGMTSPADPLNAAALKAASNGCCLACMGTVVLVSPASVSGRSSGSNLNSIPNHSNGTVTQQSHQHSNGRRQQHHQQSPVDSHKKPSTKGKHKSRSKK